ncbi:MAG: helicase-associated domain-containing protein, partial [bacterium]
MIMNDHGPLIVQSDHTLMLEVEHPEYTACRDFLVGFAELVKSPEFIHTYRLSPLSLWNAAALEIPLQEIFHGLERFSKYEIPANVLYNVREWHGAYGKLILEKQSPGRLLFTAQESYILETILGDKSLQQFWLGRLNGGLLVSEAQRGNLKHALVKAGYPVKDLCGYLQGASIDISLRNRDLRENPFRLRDYQTDAVEAFYHAGRSTGGSGVVVLPCGSGKTIIGLGIISRISNYTLIITTNNVAVHQWKGELMDKTHISSEDIGEFTGIDKSIR